MWPTYAGQTLVEIGPCFADSEHILAEIGRSAADPGRYLEEFGQARSKFGRFRANLVASLFRLPFSVAAVPLWGTAGSQAVYVVPGVPLLSRNWSIMAALSPHCRCAGRPVVKMWPVGEAASGRWQGHRANAYAPHHWLRASVRPPTAYFFRAHSGVEAPAPPGKRRGLDTTPDKPKEGPYWDMAPHGGQCARPALAGGVHS